MLACLSPLGIRPWGMLRLLQRIILVAGAVAPTGCGSSSPSAPQPAVLQVAGAYQIAPTLVQDACGGTSVAPGPAQVTQAPGANSMQLSHAGLTYTGRVEATGAFTTDALSVTLASGTAVTIGIAGRFASNGFDANVTVDETRPGASGSCRYVVRWQATKQGAPNVLPS